MKRALTKYQLLFNELMEQNCSIFYIIIREEIRDLKTFQSLLAIFKESRETWVKVILDKPYLNIDKLREVTKDMRVTYKTFNAQQDEIIEGRWWLEKSPFKFELIEYTTKSFDIEVKSEYGQEHFYQPKIFYRISRT